MSKSFLKEIVGGMCAATMKLEFIDKISDTTDIPREQLEEAYDNGFRSGSNPAAKIIQAKVEVFNLLEKYGERVVKGNPVAKNLNKFNKPATHRDRKKDDKRGKQKHRKPFESLEAQPHNIVDGIIARAKKHNLTPEFMNSKANEMVKMGKRSAAEAWRKAASILSQETPQFEGDAENKQMVSDHRAIQKQANIYAANMLKNGKGADFALQQALLAKRSGNSATFKAWRMAAKKIAANDRKMAGNYMEGGDAASEQLYAVRDLQTKEWVTKPSKSLKGQKTASRRKNMEYGAERYRPCSYPDGKVRGYS